MPYDDLGRKISKEDLIEEEYWQAENKTKITAGNVSTYLLIALFLLAGIVAVGYVVVSLVISEDLMQRCAGIISAVALASTVCMALFWSRL